MKTSKKFTREKYKRKRFSLFNDCKMYEILRDPSLQKLLPIELWCMILEYRRAAFEKILDKMEVIYNPGMVMHCYNLTENGQCIGYLYNVWKGFKFLQLRWFYSPCRTKLISHTYMIKGKSGLWSARRVTYDNDSIKINNSSYF